MKTVVVALAASVATLVAEPTFAETPSITAASCMVWGGNAKAPASATSQCVLTVIDGTALKLESSLQSPVMLSRTSPDAGNGKLTGNWISSTYVCFDQNGQLAFFTEQISIVQTGLSFVATKVTGDECVPAGHVTFYGSFAPSSQSACAPEVDRDARDAMRRARLAEGVMRSEPKYANWSIADDDYAEAASLWSKCNPSSSAMARSERTRTAQLYNQLVSGGKTNNPPDNDKCARAAAYLKQFGAGMGDNWIKDQLANMGCK